MLHKQKGEHDCASSLLNNQLVTVKQTSGYHFLWTKKYPVEEGLAVKVTIKEIAYGAYM